MAYYPVFLRLTGEPCVVIGGGEVAERKVESLLVAGARVTVVAPALTPGLSEWVARGEVVHRPRPYQDGDLVAPAWPMPRPTTRRCTPSWRAPRRGRGAAQRGRPAAVVPFIVPAVLRRGELTVAVSTGGGSPALARARDAIAAA
ncbi:MAG: NAD(P)-dependent oxidoreductase [Candidatus Binatia bacterium]